MFVVEMNGFNVGRAAFVRGEEDSKALKVDVVGFWGGGEAVQCTKGFKNAVGRRNEPDLELDLAGSRNVDRHGVTWHRWPWSAEREELDKNTLGHRVKISQ